MYEYEGNNDSNGMMMKWDDTAITWYTPDGLQPLDDPKDCGILSTFATDLDIECQLAITIAFVIGFVILLLFILFIFVIIKRR